MGPAGTDTLQRLTDRILDAHPDCGHAAALLRVSCEEPDAIARIERVLQPTGERFATRMQRLEGSAYGRRFRDLPEGAREIGCRPLLAGAVATSTIAALDGDEPPRSGHVDRVLFWRHALATGMLSLVGAELDRAHQDEAFAAGFFSTIGRLMLDRFAPDPFGEALALARSERLALNDAVAQVFGFAESELSAALVMRWHLPVWVADAIAFPVRAQEAGAHAHTLAGLVFRAELVARARGFGAEHAGMQAPPDRLRWLTDPLLIALDRIGGTGWLEAGVGGMLAMASTADGAARD